MILSCPADAGKSPPTQNTPTPGSNDRAKLLAAMQRALAILRPNERAVAHWHQPEPAIDTEVTA